MIAEVEHSFTLGGAVPPTGFYVERAADVAIGKQLLALQSCYIAQPRQIGKSSLRRHTAAMLRDQGLAVVEIDLTTLSAAPLPKLWARIEAMIAAELERLGQRPPPWLGASEVSERGLGAYIVDDVLPALDRGLVMFVDELNVLGTRGDAAIILAELKALIERRARCAVCLMGVCSPSDLVTEPSGDPSPLMTAIAIEDFTRDELAAFAPLVAGVASPERLLDAVFAVTSGHPYMVQNLLAMAVDGAPRSGSSNPGSGSDDTDADALVAELVDRKFFSPATPDPVLEIPQHTFGRGLDLRAIDALNTYRRVVAGESVPVEPEERRAPQNMLRLAGMVAFDAARTARAVSLSGVTMRASLQSRPGGLRARNAIFARRYDAAWVRDRLDAPMYATLATQWKLADRDPDFLLRGRALHAAQSWLAARSEVSADVAELIQASSHASQATDGAARPTGLGDGGIRPRPSRLARIMPYVLLAAMTVFTGVVVFDRDGEQRRAAEAARTSLLTRVDALQAEKDSTQRLMTSYQSQQADTAARQQRLQDQLSSTSVALDAVEKEKQAVRQQYDTAKQQHAGNLAALRVKLDDVTRRSDALASETERLDKELQTTRSHDQALQADLAAATTRVAKLTQDVAASQAQLGAEKQISADLTSQLEALRAKISDITGQLNDVQNKYGECVKALADARSKVEDATSRATKCESRPQP